MFLRKCSLRETYALLESESVLAHVGFSRLLNKRKACNQRIVSHAFVLTGPGPLAFQHIDRSPTAQGLLKPPSFIADLRSDKLALSASVVSHRVLVLRQLCVLNVGAHLPTLSLEWAAFLHDTRTQKKTA